MTTREAYGLALAELGAENPDVVVLDADLSKSTRTEIFAARFPERFFNVGIAEQNLMGTAAGLALAGKIPFASTFAVFATGRAFEQVRNSICHARLNVKIVASHAGITVGEDGASHQAVEDIALMRALPHMTVIVPADAVQTAQAVRAVAAYQGPVYLRLGRMAVPQVYEEGYRFRWGQADVLREGGQATVVACGLMVAAALEAAETLAREGIEVTVLNMATIKPLDVPTLVEAALRTGAVVTAEEHSIIGGLGSAVAEALAEHCPAPLLRVGLPDVFGESGRPEELLEKYGLSARHLVEAVRRVLARKAGR
ncbi:MAG: transketolase family protein [Clostridia bacterium]|jgi:transketolase|nr:transketolase family protein [Clostridia bacterium]MDH7572722.1 transketolase family protein [Clostridia bacterium]